MGFRIILVALAAGLSLAAAEPDTAREVRAAIDLYRAGHIEEAAGRFKRLSVAGSAVADTMLGHMYARGELGRPEPSVAAGRFYRAAQRGYVPAQLALARAYRDGAGLPRSYSEAYRWSLTAQRFAPPGLTGRVDRMVIDMRAKLGPRARARAESRAAQWRPWEALDGYLAAADLLPERF